MKKFVREIIRKIVYEEYNHIMIDSYEYLEFENIIIEQIFSDGFLQEDFNVEKVKIFLKENLKK